MNRTTRNHILIWTLILGLEIVAYLPNWGKPLFWELTSVNITLALSGFYFCRYFGRRLCVRLQTGQSHKMVHYPDFWYMITVVAMFIGARLCTDIFVFKFASGANIGAYLYVLARTAISFTLPGLLIGMGEMRREMIAALERKKKQLEDEIDTLESKVIQLNTAIETKEEACSKMEIEQAILAKEMNLLRFELIATREQVASLGREYMDKLKEYREIIRRMREDAEDE